MNDPQGLLRLKNKNTSSLNNSNNAMLKLSSAEAKRVSMWHRDWIVNLDLLEVHVTLDQQQRNNNNNKKNNNKLYLQQNYIPTPVRVQLLQQVWHLLNLQFL